MKFSSSAWTRALIHFFIEDILFVRKNNTNDNNSGMMISWNYTLLHVTEFVIL